MARSRVKGGGATRGRPKRKMMGKGSASLNKKVAKRLRRRVHLKLPASGC